MIWHIITRSGKEDDFHPAIGATDPRLVVAVDDSTNPNRMREHILSIISEKLGRFPSDRICDLLNIAMTVYAADLSAPRPSTTDGWTREFKLYIPVVDPAMWQSASDTLCRALSFLSGDMWDFEFRERAPRTVTHKKQRPLFDAACLFSGGLDSLVGAIDLLSAGHKVLLVGHYGGGTTSKFQKGVYDELRRVYGDAALALRFQVLPPSLERDETDAPAEETQRTRSFLFFALGVAVADAVNSDVPLYVPENGLISLNVPMTGARSGSASTRTTHPFYVKCIRELLDQLRMSHALILPYRFKTKAEMLSESANAALLTKLTPLSISCAHPDQRRREGLTPGGHCGHCFPCLIRQATVAAAGFPDATYDMYVTKSEPSAVEKKGRDLRAVRMAIARLSGVPVHRIMFEVLKSGPIEPTEIHEFVEVYKRGMAELADYYS